jgi:hypothetical protein
MRQVLGHYQKQAEQAEDAQRYQEVSSALKLLEIPPHEDERPDLDAVAEAWLDLIREPWHTKLTHRGRFKPLRLKDIRKDLKARPIATDKIRDAFSAIPSSQPIHTRVVSAIVGVPDRG